MRIDILTLFPEMFEPLKTSILKRAQDNDLIEINLINFRDFALNKHKQVDDMPFGGGDGMVLMCQPIFDAIDSIKTENSHIIYMSPKGKTLKQNMLNDYINYLSKLSCTALQCYVKITRSIECSTIWISSISHCISRHENCHILSISVVKLTDGV